MALTVDEEAQVRLLLAEEAELLNLAANEPTIISNLAVGRLTLSDLTPASVVNDADLYLTRQGVDDKSITALTLAQYFEDFFQLGTFYVKRAGDSMTGLLNLTAAGGTSVTPPPGDNDNSIATTAFVQAAINGLQSFPSGTRMLFAQVAAPTGWVQDISDKATNRMLIVRPGATGNAVGGLHACDLMNVVPAHTHSMTTGAESVGHTHTFTTGNESAAHVHNFTTGGMTANVSHSHNVILPDNTDFSRGGDAYDSGLNQTALRYDRATTSVNLDHAHSGATGNNTTNHTHSGTTANRSAGHTHSGTTDNGSSATNWQPRYLNLIVCQKS